MMQSFARNTRTGMLHASHPHGFFTLNNIWTEVSACYIRMLTDETTSMRAWGYHEPKSAAASLSVSKRKLPFRADRLRIPVRMTTQDATAACRFDVVEQTRKYPWRVKHPKLGFTFAFLVVRERAPIDLEFAALSTNQHKRSTSRIHTSEDFHISACTFQTVRVTDAHWIALLRQLEASVQYQVNVCPSSLFTASPHNSRA